MGQCRSKGQLHMLWVLGSPSLRCATASRSACCGWAVVRRGSALLVGDDCIAVKSRWDGGLLYWQRTFLLSDGGHCAVSQAIVLMISARSSHDSRSRGGSTRQPSGCIGCFWRAAAHFNACTFLPRYHDGNLPAASFYCTTESFLRAPTRIPPSPPCPRPCCQLHDASTSSSPPPESPTRCPHSLGRRPSSTLGSHLRALEPRGSSEDAIRDCDWGVEEVLCSC